MPENKWIGKYKDDTSKGERKSDSTYRTKKQTINQPNKYKRSYTEADVTIKARLFYLKFQRTFQVTKPEGDDRANYQIDTRHYYERRILKINSYRQSEVPSFQRDPFSMWLKWQVETKMGRSQDSELSGRGFS